MKEIFHKIQVSAQQAILKLYNEKIDKTKILLQFTKSEFNGDITLVVFPLLKISQKSPVKTAEEIAVYLNNHLDEIENYNIIKGFLNISIKNSYFFNAFYQIGQNLSFGFKEANSKHETIMVEFSSPNTNKPLHLGHVRNCLLGYSLVKILEANGYKVIKTNIVNDRGIHICKSMYAWKEFSQNATPKSTNRKGDHFVGDYYVLFNDKLNSEIDKLTKQGLSKEEATKKAPSILAVRKMLQQWENNDKEVRGLWQKMNSWVYDGYNQTYEELGITFDKIYYESDTYLIGRKKVFEGLKENIFYQKKDGSIWLDLTEESLDNKLFIRSDGTSVYITQDIGTAHLRYADYQFDKMIYVVGNEQNYHFQVLAKVLNKLGYKWGKTLIHYSYGMVELPEGKMKSREGNIVDADDLISEMKIAAHKISKEAGKLGHDKKDEKHYKEIIDTIAMGALKYFILKVDPKKNMLFDPKESIDFNGNTGPFIQYTHARICSVLEKVQAVENDYLNSKEMSISIDENELLLIKNILIFPQIVEQAGEELNPTVLTSYCYDLAKQYNKFYHDNPILNASNEKLKNFRLLLSQKVKIVLKNGMSLLGISLPNKM